MRVHSLAAAAIFLPIMGTPAVSADGSLPRPSSITWNTVMCETADALGGIGHPGGGPTACENLPAAGIMSVLAVRYFPDDYDAPCMRMAFEVSVRWHLDEPGEKLEHRTGWIPGSQVLPQLCDWSNASTPPRPQLNPEWARYLSAHGILPAGVH